MGRTAKTPTVQELTPEATSFDVTATSLYWFGMLPATGTFKQKQSTREKDSQTNDYFTYVDVTSQQLWEGEVNQWVGKCPWKQSLSVSGLSFDAFTETRLRAVGQDASTLNKISWPGAITELEEDRFKHVIGQCYQNVIRMEDNVGKDINLNGPKRGTYMMLDSGVEKSTKEQFNPRTDTYFAHYVYIVKLEADPRKYDRSSYYSLAMPWNEFFIDPPKSVAELYPLEKKEAGKPPAP